MVQHQQAAEVRAVGEERRPYLGGVVLRLLPLAHALPRAVRRDRRHAGWLGRDLLELGPLL